MHPPFSELDDDALHELLDAASVTSYEDGALVLAEGGAPAEALSVVRRGAVELRRGGEALDVLGPGESFGFPSLLTGDRPAFDVRARGATQVLAVDRAMAERLLGTVAGLRYVARQLRERAELIAQADRDDVAAAIEAAPTLPELIDRASSLPRAIADLQADGVAPAAASREMARGVEATVRRALALHLADREVAPAPWAWLLFGSVARYEPGLRPDQDHTIVWDGGADLDHHFAELAGVVTDTLEASGFPRCPSGILATSPGWRGSVDAWADRVLEPAATAQRDAFLLAIALDARQVAGSLDTASMLSRLRRGAAARPRWWRVARLALGSQPPISSFGTLITERDGPRRYVDVKAGGLLPVTDLARAAALQAGADDVETHRRLSAAAQGGALTDADAAALHEAFETFQELRLECDAERLRAGMEPDGRVDPTTLDPINRIRLREAFKVVGVAQSHLRASVGGGRFRFPTAG